MLPFLDRGHQVVGIEPAHEPVERLRELLTSRGQTANIIEGFIQDASIPGAFDVVIFSWLCYGYIPQASRRIAVLKRVAEHLRPGGRIVINYIATEPSRRERMIQLTRWAAKLSRSDWTPENNDVLRNERNNAGERVLAYEHWFVPGEIDQEARNAGLRVISSEGPVGIPVAVLAL